MASITEMKDRFVSLLSGLGGVIIYAYKDTEAEAVDLNRSQMMDGITSAGKNTGEYSEVTKQIKKAKGQQSEWVTLYDEGDFQGAMKFQTLNEQYAAINSSDWKTDKLTEKYGSDIFGLTEQNVKLYARENWFVSFINKVKELLWQK